eukprot:1157898-Pelagomonas_calceolata.AAC.12
MFPQGLYGLATARETRADWLGLLLVLGDDFNVSRHIDSLELNLAGVDGGTRASLVQACFICYWLCQLSGLISVLCTLHHSQFFWGCFTYEAVCLEWPTGLSRDKEELSR